MSNKIEGVPEGWELVRVGRAEAGDWCVDSTGKLHQFTSPSAQVYPIARKLPEPLKIEAGKYYRTKAGQQLGPMFHLRDAGAYHWAYKKGQGGLWSDSGKHNFERDDDFVAEVPATYRPFANAEEFRPFRDKWLVPKQCSDPKNLCFRIDCYCDRGYDTRNGIIGWKSTFQDFVFEDGTTCGVRVS